jgi:hypothetical protein
MNLPFGEQKKNVMVGGVKVLKTWVEKKPPLSTAGIKKNVRLYCLSDTNANTCELIIIQFYKKMFSLKDII